MLGPVAAEIEQFPAALIVSLRPQPRSPQLERLLAVFAARGSANLLVGPLDQRSSEQLLESLVATSPGQRLVRQAGRAGGNPLFLCELAGALVADGTIVYGEDAAELATDAAAPLTVRRGLHAEFASALAAAGRPPAQAADHVILAAAPGDEHSIASIASIVSVARDLVGRAPGPAASMHQHAIKLSASPIAMREQLLPELAGALIAAGQLREGEQACREALARELDPEWAGQLRLHLMFLLLRQGRTQEAIGDDPRGIAFDGAHLWIADFGFAGVTVIQG